MKLSPLSLYIHIPFCVRKCRYCDFYSVPYNEQLADRYIDALSTELKLTCQELELHNPTIDTIFFGGGTPSLLSVEQWDRMCELITANVSLSKQCEWTIECNPDSFSNEKAQSYLESGVTRLTFGAQSLNRKELSVMGRVHSGERTLEVLDDQSLQQFQSIGVDLIYGLPGQTMNSLLYSLDTLLNHSLIKHISVYELSINKDTPFGKHHSILPLPGDDLSYEMAIAIFNRCEQKGFEQYEISNFALPGYHCLHNAVYWNHDCYIGLGCSAHSYIHPFRYANHNDIIKYIQFAEKNILPRRDCETIDSQTMAREMIFLGVRRKKGIDELTFEQKTGLHFTEYAGKETLSLMLEQGLLLYQNSCWKPTQKGILIADTLARNLINYESIT